jgi:hypothetical protein
MYDSIEKVRELGKYLHFVTLINSMIENPLRNFRSPL